MLKSVLKCIESIRILKKWVKKNQNLSANLVGGGGEEPAKLVKNNFLIFLTLPLDKCIVYHHVAKAITAC